MQGEANGKILDEKTKENIVEDKKESNSRGEVIKKDGKGNDQN